MTKEENKVYRIPCETIQDLMPSYVDGLASEATAEIIEDHVKECGDCSAVLNNMKAEGEAIQKPDDRDRKEIDFLKKSRNRGRRAIAVGILLTALLIMVPLGVKKYVIGSEYRGDMACDLRVDGNTMTVGVTAADSVHVIHGLEFTMKDGVARGKAMAVLPGIFHSEGTFTRSSDDGDTGSFNTSVCDWAEDFTFGEEIKEVRIGDRIYWTDGKMIPEEVSELYCAGHDYVGDASANGRSINALGIVEDLGSLYNELQTAEEPYVWTIILDEDQAKYRTEYLQKRLEGYGYALLGTVGNLGEVDFRYTADGKTMVTKVTAEDATAFLGKDIKICRTDAGALSELMEKAGLLHDPLFQNGTIY